MTEDEFRALALTFPGAQEGFTMGSAVFKVSGKVLARSLPGEMVMFKGLPIEEIEVLAEADPQVFTSDSRNKYRGRVLARLTGLDGEVARGFLSRRFRQIASRSVLARWERAGD